MSPRKVGAAHGPRHPACSFLVFVSCCVVLAFVGTLDGLLHLVWPMLVRCLNPRLSCFFVFFFLSSGAGETQTFRVWDSPCVFVANLKFFDPCFLFFDLYSIIRSYAQAISSSGVFLVSVVVRSDSPSSVVFCWLGFLVRKRERAQANRTLTPPHSHFFCCCLPPLPPFFCSSLFRRASFLFWWFVRGAFFDPVRFRILSELVPLRLLRPLILVFWTLDGGAFGFFCRFCFPLCVVFCGDTHFH